jgi:hypothetical protein
MRFIVEWTRPEGHLQTQKILRIAFLIVTGIDTVILMT